MADDQQKLLETLVSVFDDLQTFLIQKSHQHIIYAFLQIKKLSRRGIASSKVSVDRKSIASVSQKNYSQRKKSVDNSAKKSLGKQSHASFDIIKGAEFFNQSRKNKPHYQKQYTQVSRNQRSYMDNQNDQPTRFTGPYNNNANNQVLQRNNTPQIVPKLVGLVSSDEISDIQRPSGRSHRIHQLRVTERFNERGLNYDKSIVEVQDDDDQFEDVVLNRLDKIEEKVNLMLRDKRKQKIQVTGGNYIQSRPPMTPQNNFPVNTRLQNVNSGSNIVHTRTTRGNRNCEFYKYQEPRYNLSSDQMMNPQAYTFQNNKNKSYVVLNKRVSESNGIRPQFTQRAHKLSSRILSQLPNYMTDNQQYVEGGYSHPVRRQGMREAETVIVYQQNLPQYIEQEKVLIKDKRLGHYRDSSGTIRYPTESSQQRPTYSRDQQMIEKQSDYSRLRQQAFIDGENVYKYIPMAKYVPEKTERHVITRRVEGKEYNQLTNQQMYQQHRVGKVIFIDKLGRQVVKTNRADEDKYSQGAPRIKDDIYYKNSKNNGIRFRHLQDSNIRAYTQHGDFIPSADDFSVSSDGGIYSQIRQLRQITKQHGLSKDQRRQNYKNRNIVENQYLVIKKQKPQQLQEQNNLKNYRYHQKTQRNRYVPSQKYSQNSHDEYREEVIIRGPVHERVYKVVRKTPNYTNYSQRQELRIKNQSGSIHQPLDNQQYVEYVPVQQKVVYRTASHNGSLHSNQSINVNRQNSKGYQDIQQNEISHTRRSRQTQIHTNLIKDDNRSQKKLSTGSINTFKSIPYRQDSRKNTIKEMIEKDKNVQYVESQSQHSKHSEFQEQV